MKINLNEIKQKIIIVKYILIDIAPQKGLKRLQYFTMFSDEPDKYYLGFSFRTSYKEDFFNNKLDSIISLKKEIELPYEKDLWLNSYNELIIADADDPINDNNKITIIL